MIQKRMELNHRIEVSKIASIILCLITVLMITICVFSPLIRVDIDLRDDWEGYRELYRKMIYFTGHSMVYLISLYSGNFDEITLQYWNDAFDSDVTLVHTVLFSVAYSLILISSLVWMIVETHKTSDTMKKFSLKLGIVSFLSITGSITGFIASFFLLKTNFYSNPFVINVEFQFGFYLSFTLFVLFSLIGLAIITRIIDIRNRLVNDFEKVNRSIFFKKMIKTRKSISASLFSLVSSFIGIIVLLFFPLLQAKDINYTNPDGLYYRENIFIRQIFFNGFEKNISIENIADPYVDFFMRVRRSSWWEYPFVFSTESPWRNFPKISMILLVSAIILSVLTSIIWVFLATHKESQTRFKIVPYVLLSFFIVSGLLGIAGLCLIIPHLTFLNSDQSLIFHFTFSWYFGFVLFIINIVFGIGIFSGIIRQGNVKNKKITFFGLWSDVEGGTVIES